MAPDPLASRLASIRYRHAAREFDLTTSAVDGVPLKVRVAGPADAPAHLVMVAGLGLSGRYLLPCGARLARELRVWVPDVPRHLRDRGADGVDMAAVGRVVVAWMEAAGLDRAAVAANSMGCQVAVEMALAAPERVTHLVLEGATIDASARTRRRQAGRVVIDATREPPSLGVLQSGDWVRTGPRVLHRLVRATFAHAIEERIADVGCPTLVVCGGRDPIAPEPWARRLADTAPAGRLHVVPHGTHAQAYSNPAGLADVIGSFVAPSTRPSHQWSETASGRGS